MGAKNSVTLKDSIARFADGRLGLVFNLNPVLARRGVVEESAGRVGVDVAQLAEAPAAGTDLATRFSLALRNAVGKNGGFLRRQTTHRRLY